MNIKLLNFEIISPKLNRYVYIYLSLIGYYTIKFRGEIIASNY